MIYPKNWDVTSIQITPRTKSYNGYTSGTPYTINVRMEFGYKKIVTLDSVSVDCSGLFYKQGSISLNKGDTATFNGLEYEIVQKQEYRLENGNIEYTKVWFK